MLELFFQVFDKGMMEDGEGREIDFKNTIIILTSNAGTDTMMKLTADPETMPSSRGAGEGAEAGAEQDLQAGVPRPPGDHPVFPVRDEALKSIVRLKLGQDPAPAAGDAQNRADTRRSDVVDEVAKRCTEVESGAATSTTS